MAFKTTCPACNEEVKSKSGSVEFCGCGYLQLDDAGVVSTAMTNNPAPSPPFYRVEPNIPVYEIRGGGSDKDGDDDAKLPGSGTTARRDTGGDSAGSDARPR